MTLTMHRRTSGAEPTTSSALLDADRRGGRRFGDLAVAGLDAEDTGVVTFTDANNNKVAVNVTGGQTSYTADFSTLADGTITSSLQVATHSAGNTSSLLPVVW